MEDTSSACSKIIITGDIFYGYAFDCAKSWVIDYKNNSRKGVCGYYSERGNIKGTITKLKSGTYKVFVYEAEK